MNSPLKLTDWLPISREEVEKRGWDGLDVIIVSGDAYVDHPAFGHAVIGRLVEKEGLRVAILPQPNWRDDLRDFKKLGAPRLFFGVTSGCMDSMVNHYTAGKRLRSDDAYTPGGVSNFRPDYAVTVYTRILKELYPETPVIIGGMEASMRRFTHYDYWSDSLKPSILAESGADLLVYGMGEQPLREILSLLKKGVPFGSLKTIPQTALLLAGDAPLPKRKGWKPLELASHEACMADKKRFAATFKVIETESNRVHATRLVQETGEGRVIVNPPFPVMKEAEIDASFDLPFTRLPHPRYKKRGAIPAYEMIRHSITLHRGCFGGCSFCAISAHQGKFVTSRSRASILKEVEAVTQMPDFTGTISDLGGPSANMYRMKGEDQPVCDACARPSCIYPDICFNLETSHKPLTDIYRTVSSHPSVKKAFVTSGLRYDLFLRQGKKYANKGYDEYLKELVENHVSGRLKVAPEHTAPNILKLMRKPTFEVFKKLKERFDKISKKKGLKQQIVPYFISSHPGCELKDMAGLAAETKELGFKLEQVQDFTPTPMTLATVIYYSGYNPYGMKPLYSAKGKEERRDQNRLFFWYKKENRQWIKATLARIGASPLGEKLLK